MTGGRRARAFWAEFGKVPHDPMDYRVIAAHEGRSQYYDQQIRPFLPGTPESRAGAAPLPWYTFWYVPGGDTPWSAVSALDLTDMLDAAGRPIALLRYFSMPFGMIAGSESGQPAVVGAASYATLAAAVRDATRPADESGQVELEVAAADWAAVAGTIRRLGFDWVAAGAAGLLDGRVVITGAGSLPVADRLACLDAIAALLPYGARATLAAATYADSAGLHRIRLFFGDFAPDDATELLWDGPEPPAPPPGGAAAEYLALLRTWWNAQLADGAAAPCPEQPGALACYRARVDLDEPAPLIALVRELTRTSVAAAAFHQARTERAWLLGTLAQRPLGPDTSQGARRTIAEELLAADVQPPLTPAQFQNIGLHWSAENSALVIRALRDLLTRPGGVDLAVEYGELARDANDLDQLISALFKDLDLNAPGAGRAFATVLSRLGIDLNADLPNTRALLTAENPRAIGLHADEIRHRLAASAQATVDVRPTAAEDIRLLLRQYAADRPDAPVWLGLLADLERGRADEVRLGELERLCREGDRYPQIMLDAGHAFGRLPTAVDWLFRPLSAVAATPGLPPARRDALVRALNRLDAAEPSVARAKADLLLLTLGADPAGLLHAHGASFDRIHRDFVGLLAGIKHAALLSRRLVDALGNGAAAPDAGRSRGGAAAVLRLLGGTVQDRALDWEAVIWLERHRAETDAEWQRDPPAARLCDRLQALIGDPAGPVLLPERARLSRIRAVAAQPGKGVDDLAAELRAALDAGCPADKVVRGLRSWPMAADIRELHRLFGLVEGVEAAEPGETYDALARAVVQDALGRDVAVEFRGFYRDLTRDYEDRLSEEQHRSAGIGRQAMERRGWTETLVRAIITRLRHPIRGSRASASAGDPMGEGPDR